MTTNADAVRKRAIIHEKTRSVLYPFVFVFFFFVTVTNAEACRSAVVNSAKTCLYSIFPTVFPFMVLSDFLASAFSDTQSGRSALLWRIFGISPCMKPALICGNVCGFPIGVRMASKMFSDGKITKEELENAIGLVNNPSAPFVISAIGACMLKSVRDGILLYISIIAATITVGMLVNKKCSNIKFQGNNSRQYFNISESIKNAGLSCIAVFSYIIFFSYLSCVLSFLVRDTYLSAMISALIEVGSGSAMIGALGLPRSAALPLIALALGFSGFSVHMQAFGLLPKGISKKRYFVMKFTEGAIAMIITYLFCRLTAK